MTNRVEHAAGRKVNHRRSMMWAAIAGLVLLPVVAMRFTNEMAWDAADFAFFTILLVGAGALYELTAWMTDKATYRAAIGAVLVAAVFLIWLDAAAGIF